jgi:tryptophan 7-halogenase
MNRHRADSFRMRADHEGQIVLEFGHMAVAAPGVALDPDRAFVPTDSIVMAPDVLRRLADGLAEALGLPPSPSDDGAMAAPKAQPAAPAMLQQPPPPAAWRSGAGLLPPAIPSATVARQHASAAGNPPPPDPGGDLGPWLMQAVAAMAPSHYLERSFRIAPRALHDRRFLLSIGAQQLPPDAFDLSWAICRQLGLPAALRPEIEAAFQRADHVHFGIEGEPGRQMCKLYLEHTVTGLQAATSRQTGEPALQYLAYKWRPGSQQPVVSQYHWFAGLSPAGMVQRLASLCGAEAPALFQIARSVLDSAARRLAPERLLYLEVSEAGQPRRSFDLNLYDARLRVCDLQPAMLAMRDHFAVSHGQFQALYDRIASSPMGHLAGGIHRDGQPFFNVYYGGTRRR